MKLHRSHILLCSALGCALAFTGTAQPGRTRRGVPPPPAPAQPGVFTTVSGTILQFNYGPEAEVEGFRLNKNTMVHLPAPAAARVDTSVHIGDSVQITGLAHTSPTGNQLVEAQSIQDRTSGKTLTVPQPGAAAPFSGSGRVQQLNYAPDGAVNGFLFENGTLVRVSPFAASNPTSIKVGTTVAYSGYARNTISGRTVVEVQTLTVNGQTLNMAAARPAGPPPIPPVAGIVAPPSAPRPPTAPNAAGQPPPPAPPVGRTDEPPPPPQMRP